MDIKRLTGSIIMALLFAAFWVAIVFVAAFPSLLETEVSFLTQRFTYETTGMILILANAVILIDLMIEVIYSYKTVDRNHVLLWITVSGILCMLLVPVSTARGLTNHTLLISMSALFFAKTISLFSIDLSKMEIFNSKLELFKL